MSHYYGYASSSDRRWRNTGIAAFVVLFHIGTLWALQQGLSGRPAEPVVAVDLIGTLIELPQVVDAPLPAPPAPVVAPPRPVVEQPPKKPAQIKKRPDRAKPPPVLAAAPNLPAEPDAPTGEVAEAPVPEDAEVSHVDVPETPGASKKEAGGGGGAQGQGESVSLPVGGVGHMNNPAPTYPAVSRKLGEQGTVLLRVLVGADGHPQKVELLKSSGYRRLDEVAIRTVEQRWRFSPGKRAGVAVAMTVDQPIKFILN